jgi:hypothetical protein
MTATSEATLKCLYSEEILEYLRGETVDYTDSLFHYTILPAKTARDTKYYQRKSGHAVGELDPALSRAGPPDGPPPIAVKADGTVF